MDRTYCVITSKLDSVGGKKKKNHGLNMRGARINVGRASLSYRLLVLCSTSLCARDINVVLFSPCFDYSTVFFFSASLVYICSCLISVVVVVGMCVRTSVEPSSTLYYCCT